MLRRIGLLLACTLLAACGAGSAGMGGVSHLSGPSLAAFGLAPRCDTDSTCMDAAFARLEAALSRLGQRADNREIDHPNEPLPEDRLAVTFERDPMIEWRTDTGVSGSSARVVVDLTDSSPYVVVAPGQGFELDPADAAAIRDALFVAAP